MSNLTLLFLLFLDTLLKGMGINTPDKDNVIILKGRIFKILVNQMPPTFPFPHSDMYDLRYKKEGENILHIYVTCNVGIIDDTKIQDYFNDLISRPQFDSHIKSIISCTYHEEYTWLSDNDDDDDDDDDDV